MNIIKIVKDYDAFPIRWILTTDEHKEITVRERGKCVVYWGVKSIFSVTDEDIITIFDVEEQNDDNTLIEALNKIGAVLLPEVLKNVKINYEND